MILKATGLEAAKFAWVCAKGVCTLVVVASGGAGAMDLLDSRLISKGYAPACGWITTPIFMKAFVSPNEVPTEQLIGTPGHPAQPGKLMEPDTKVKKVIRWNQVKTMEYNQTLNQKWYPLPKEKPQIGPYKSLS